MEKNKNITATPIQKQVKIRIDNLKCGGCETSIEMGLLGINGVIKAHVIRETSEVEVTYYEGTDLAIIKNKLKQLGYPESGTTEGFEKLATNVKSYVSCAIGKMNKKDEKK